MKIVFYIQYTCSMQHLTHYPVRESLCEFEMVTFTEVYYMHEMNVYAINIAQMCETACACIRHTHTIPHSPHCCMVSVSTVKSEMPITITAHLNIWFKYNFFFTKSAHYSHNERLKINYQTTINLHFNNSKLCKIVCEYNCNRRSALQIPSNIASHIPATPSVSQ